MYSAQNILQSKRKKKIAENNQEIYQQIRQ